MNTALRFLLLTLMIGTLASCGRKEVPTSIHGFFYTPDASMGPENPVHLFMDGVDKGVLPYIATASKDEALTAKDSIIRTQTLQFDFPSGEHMLEARTTEGTFVCSSRMYVRYYKNGCGGGFGPGTGGGGASLDGNTRQYVAYLYR